MIHFVGAGPGAVDLITVRGKKLLEEADLVVYAGSLINTELLNFTSENCEKLNSAYMTLEEVIDALISGDGENKNVVRLHTGDPSIYGAIREQMDILSQNGVEYSVVPGVSSFSAAAASLKAEYTLPNVSQTLILTRMEGRTKVPPKEDISFLSTHEASMAIFLSAGMLGRLSEKLQHGYSKDTKAAIVYKASWDDEKIIHTTIEKLEEDGKKAGITKTALILVGEFLGDEYDRSLLYHPEFTHLFRKGKDCIENDQ